jgi:outer membrane protein TolC
VSLTQNPAAREQNAATAVAEARLKVLVRSYYPRFALQGTTYARGTGAMPDGRLLGGLNGLGPTTQNWALGFTASFNILDYAAIRARRSAEASQLEAEKAKYDQVLLELRARQGKAQAAFEGAAEIARTAPAAIASARAGDEQARARYQAGLGTALEVADAQRRLAQAEIDDSLARLSMWRAKLGVAAAAGDLGPVLAEASR